MALTQEQWVALLQDKDNLSIRNQRTQMSTGDDGYVTGWDRANDQGNVAEADVYYGDQLIGRYVGGEILVSGGTAGLNNYGTYRFKADVNPDGSIVNVDPNIQTGEVRPSAWLDDNMWNVTMAGLLAMAGGAAYMSAGEAAAVGAAENGIIGSTVGMGAGEAGAATAAGAGAGTASAGAGAADLGAMAAAGDVGGFPAAAAGGAAATPSLASTLATTNTAANVANAAGSGGSTAGSGDFVGPPTNAAGSPEITGIPWLDTILRGAGSAGSNILGSLGSGEGLMRLLTAAYDSNRNNQFADRLLGMYAPYQEQASWYGDRLRETYTNPERYYQTPEWLGVQRTTGDYLQRQDAAGGRLSNDFARQAKLQDLAAGNLAQYRSGLQGIYTNMAGIGTGQGAVNAQSAWRGANDGLAGVIGNLGSTNRG